MTIHEIYSIRDRGTVVTGQIENGTLHVGDEILIQRQGSTRKAVVAGIEIIQNSPQHARSVDNISVLFRDINFEDVHNGDVLLGSEPKATEPNHSGLDEPFQPQKILPEDNPKAPPCIPDQQIISLCGILGVVTVFMLNQMTGILPGGITGNWISGAIGGALGAIVGIIINSLRKK
jgi:hypothetical protein